VSGYVFQQHAKSGFPAEKITIRNNGLDTSTIGIQGSPWVERKGVAFAGRISEAKGSKVLLHLIKNVKEPLNIVGSGPDLDKLEFFNHEEGFQHVTFWGNQPHEKTLEILGSSICTVVPSQCGESFPTVATESMALGTPVVASDLGGLSQLLAESGGGIVVPPHALDDFVDTICLLLNSSEKARSIGQLGMQYVTEHLASEEKSKELAAIYQEVITGAKNNDHQL
jgi:glycosyltransferase involved in cell wall biosynthesis